MRLREELRTIETIRPKEKSSNPRISLFLNHPCGHYRESNTQPLIGI